MELKFWGVRSDVPAALSTEEIRLRIRQAVSFARDIWSADLSRSPEDVVSSLPAHVSGMIGGETRCFEITHGEDRLIIDLGTGARRLGYDLMMRGIKGNFHILLSSTRWDHIQGWPFFVPGYIPGNSMTFYSRFADLQERLERQQDFAFFPVGFQESASSKSFAQIGEGPSNILSFEVRCSASTSAGESDSLRISAGGRTIVIAGPSQLRQNPDLAANAALLVIQDVDHAVHAELSQWKSQCPVILTDHPPGMSDVEIAQSGAQAAREMQTVTV